VSQETSKDYRAGFRDALQIVSALFEMAATGAKDLQSHEALEKIREGISRIQVPRFTR
jgi:hypothetical protein